MRETDPQTADDRRRPRQAYQKPRLRVIDLTVEETLAIGCKAATSGNAFNAVPCVINSCAAPGS